MHYINSVIELSSVNLSLMMSPFNYGTCNSVDLLHVMHSLCMHCAPVLGVVFLSSCVTVVLSSFRSVLSVSCRSVAAQSQVVAASHVDMR